MNVKANVADDQLVLWTKTDIELPCNVQLYLTAIMPWNDDITYAMTVFKVITLPSGVWPLQKYNAFALIRCIIYSFSLAVWVITLFLEINYGNNDAYVNLDCLMLMLCGVLSVLKLSSFRLFANNLTRNFSSAVNDYLAIDSEEKRTIMRRHAYLGRMICFSTLFFSYVASVFFVVSSMMAEYMNVDVNASVTKQASELPIPLSTVLGSYPISTSLYFVICFLQFGILIFNSNANCGSDAFFLSILLHVCGQMELLKIEFMNYGVKSKNMSEDFRVLASRHLYLMEHAELLVDVISVALLAQLLFSCLIICFIGFQFILAVYSHDLVMISKTISVMGALLLQLYFYSFVGDYLKCQTEDIAQSIYSCDWYCFPAKLMKNIVFVLMRTQQPVQLLAGRFFVVNIETYMSILKTSFSYLSVLRVMVDT